MIEAYSDKVGSAHMDQKSKRDSALLAITVRCVALVGLLMINRASGEAQPPVRQVLLLQSFDRGNMIVDHFTGNLRVDLDRNVGSPVNVVQVVVGPTGFVGASEQAIVDFIESAYAARPKPDLIVSLGGPASLFARKFPTAALSRRASADRGHRSAMAGRCAAWRERDRRRVQQRFPRVC